MKDIRKMVVENKSECVHDLNREDNTLKILPKRIMTVPPTLICVCKFCNQGFKFVQNNDGLYSEE
ncbi:MAG TPA: hypothetical protein DCW90_03940 [Lachnospiraceae bacterium]|nr:hypothetical protein [Lachnospiraceae bacterium]